VYLHGQSKYHVSGPCKLEAKVRTQSVSPEGDLRLIRNVGVREAPIGASSSLYRRIEGEKEGGQVARTHGRAEVTVGRYPPTVETCRATEPGEDRGRYGCCRSAFAKISAEF
jgi:hypothetical protein